MTWRVHWQGTISSLDFHSLSISELFLIEAHIEPNSIVLFVHLFVCLVFCFPKYVRRLVCGTRPHIFAKKAFAFPSSSGVRDHSFQPQPCLTRCCVPRMPAVLGRAPRWEVSGVRVSWEPWEGPLGGWKRELRKLSSVYGANLVQAQGDDSRSGQSRCPSAKPCVTAASVGRVCVPHVVTASYGHGGVAIALWPDVGSTSTSPSLCKGARSVFMCHPLVNGRRHLFFPKWSWKLKKKIDFDLGVCFHLK